MPSDARGASSIADFVKMVCGNILVANEDQQTKSSHITCLNFDYRISFQWHHN